MTQVVAKEGFTPCFAYLAIVFRNRITIILVVVAIPVVIGSNNGTSSNTFHHVRGVCWWLQAHFCYLTRSTSITTRPTITAAVLATIAISTTTWTTIMTYFHYLSPPLITIPNLCKVCCVFFGS